MLLKRKMRKLDRRLRKWLRQRSEKNDKRGCGVRLEVRHDRRACRWHWLGGLVGSMSVVAETIVSGIRTVSAGGSRGWRVPAVLRSTAMLRAWKMLKKYIRGEFGEVDGGDDIGSHKSVRGSFVRSFLNVSKLVPNDFRRVDVSVSILSFYIERWKSEGRIRLRSTRATTRDTPLIFRTVDSQLYIVRARWPVELTLCIEYKSLCTSCGYGGWPVASSLGVSREGRNLALLAVDLTNVDLSRDKLGELYYARRAQISMKPLPPASCSGL